ncbi:MAG: Si-specific NAD(P)(+) transhydrogenase [bacterium]|nr:Si-specific NAD(P)(+) transhydrogenase [bacterium]
MKNYDLLVIGSGPAGERAAVQAAKLKKRVAIIEKGRLVGGVSLHTGTLPSKTLRETVLHYSQLRRRSVYGIQCYLRQDISVQELMFRKDQVIQSELDVIEGHLFRNNIEIVYGTASFIDSNTLEVKLPDGNEAVYKGEVILIATGTRPARPREIPFDDANVYDGESILKLNRIPKSMAVVGGGVIGCEYASIFSNLGIKITLFDSRQQILSNLDRELVEALQYQMRKNGMVLHLNEQVSEVAIEANDRVRISCVSGKIIHCEKLLYAIGRIGNTDKLNLDAIGLKPNQRGFLEVNGHFQTQIPHVYAAGDVIGQPMLASVSQDQGRIAMCWAFGGPEDRCSMNRLLPYAIYTIPEISIVGETEESLTAQNVPYEIGHAFYREVARGQIINEPDGMVKLLFNRESLNLLGVHILGSRASELIHIGQAVLSFGGKITYFIDTVFNYPTLSEAYKIAALNGINRLG